MRALLAAAVLVASSTVAFSAPSDALDLVDVRVAGLDATATLAPFDVRSSELAQSGPSPLAAWTGVVDGTGGLVRLVRFDGLTQGVVQVSDDFRWVVLQDGVLVEPPAGLFADLPPTRIDGELARPDAAAAAPPLAAAGEDGVLQMFVDGDLEYAKAVGARHAEHQLAVMTLLDAVYRVSLDVPIEVVGMHVWTSPPPFTGSITCTGGSEDLLRQFRDHYEASSPTESDVREVAHLMTRQPRAPHPSGGTLIGCGWIGALESPWAYGASWMGWLGLTTAAAGTGPLAPALHSHVLIVAHELGHNFGGEHHRAFPTPGSAVDVARCDGATIMYPYLCENAPVFSRDNDGRLTGAGLLRDGGNVPHMKAHAAERI